MPTEEDGAWVQSWLPREEFLCMLESCADSCQFFLLLTELFYFLLLCPCFLFCKGK